MVLWTLFFFILTMNLLGLVPSDRIIWLITHKENHLYGAPTGNIWVTGALALFSFIFFHAAGIMQNGIKNYIKDFCPKVPWIMWPPMFFLELVSSFVRMFSLAIRLFANILAGHILLATILGFIILYKNYMVATASISFTVVMSFLEIFVAFLQAYIFTFLTAIFIGFAIHPEH
jgi:F-type H+-transporting ATPase subunit a